MGQSITYEDDLDDDFIGHDSCPYCWGTGVVVVCWDDVCHAMDECFHGDGLGVCPECMGTGDLNWRDVAHE